VVGAHARRATQHAGSHLHLRSALQLNAEGNAGLGWQQRGRPRGASWWPASEPVGLAVLSFCLSMLPFDTKGSNSQKEYGGGGERAWGCMEGHAWIEACTPSWKVQVLAWQRTQQCRRQLSSQSHRWAACSSTKGAAPKRAIHRGYRSPADSGGGDSTEVGRPQQRNRVAAEGQVTAVHASHCMRTAC
jgi:hypothetical protein